MGGDRKRKLTPTNTPCRGHRHPKAQNTHTEGLAMGLDKCETCCCTEDTQRYGDACKGDAYTTQTCLRAAEIILKTSATVHNKNPCYATFDQSDSRG